MSVNIESRDSLVMHAKSYALMAESILLPNRPRPRFHSAQDAAQETAEGHAFATLSLALSALAADMPREAPRGEG